MTTETTRVVRVTRAGLWALGVLFILLPATVVGLCTLPSPMAIVAPGPVEPVDALIQIEGTSYAPQGRLYLTPVRVLAEPRLGHFLLARLQPDVSVVPKGQAASPFLSPDEYQAHSQRLLEESQIIAHIVALRQAGYEVKLGAGEVQVVATAPGSEAEALLQPGDLVESVDGETIQTAAELISLVQGHLTGEPVVLRIRRGRRPLTITLPAVRGPVDSEGPVLGLVAVTRRFDWRAPIRVTMATGAVAGGPSTGLMYALGIYNGLVTDDITRGHRVAGTGSLRLSGLVGPVGAVGLKVRAAENAGAEYFLVPTRDAQAAREAARDIAIIPVHDFQEALVALRRLDSDPAGNPRVVPAGGDHTLARHSAGWNMRAHRN